LPTHPTDEVQKWARTLLALLDRVGDAGPRVEISRDGKWLRTSVGPTLSLRRKAVLAALLARLAEELVSAPGRSISKQALKSAAWGSEKMTESAASNRLHVALTRLRGLGLERALIFDEVGWRLDGKSVTIVEIDASD
jgi:hypothetical protein